MSYPRNAATPKPVGIGALVKISDGTLLGSTSTVSSRVQLDGGAWGNGGGTIGVDATGSIFTYAPIQAETNGDVLNVTLYCAGYISITATIYMDPAGLKVDVDTVKTRAVADPGAITVYLGNATHALVVDAAGTAAANVVQWDSTTDVVSYLVDLAAGTSIADANVVGLNGSTTMGVNVATGFVSFFNVASGTRHMTLASYNQGADGNTILTALNTVKPDYKLDVASTGEAGLDFNNIKDATGAHTLTNITVPTVTTLTTWGGGTAPTTGEIVTAMEASVGSNGLPAIKTAIGGLAPGTPTNLDVTDGSGVDISG